MPCSASQVQMAFPKVKVNKKSCSVKIGGMSQSFAIPPAGQLFEVVRIVNEFFEAGEEERKTLNVQTKPLGETKVIGIHDLLAFNSFWLP